MHDVSMRFVSNKFRAVTVEYAAIRAINFTTRIISCQVTIQYRETDIVGGFVANVHEMRV